MACFEMFQPGVLLQRAMWCDLECPCKIYDQMQTQVISGEMLPPSGKQVQLLSIVLWLLLFDLDVRVSHLKAVFTFICWRRNVFFQWLILNLVKDDFYDTRTSFLANRGSIYSTI